MRWAVWSFRDGPEEEEVGRWTRVEREVLAGLVGEGVRDGEPMSVGKLSAGGWVEAAGSEILGSGPTSQRRIKGA